MLDQQLEFGFTSAEFCLQRVNQSSYQSRGRSLVFFLLSYSFITVNVGFAVKIP